MVSARLSEKRLAKGGASFEPVIQPGFGGLVEGSFEASLAAEVGEGSGTGAGDNEPGGSDISVFDGFRSLQDEGAAAAVEESGESLQADKGGGVVVAEKLEGADRGLAVEVAGEGFGEMDLDKGGIGWVPGGGLGALDGDFGFGPGVGGHLFEFGGLSEFAWRLSPLVEVWRDRCCLDAGMPSQEC